MKEKIIKAIIEENINKFNDYENALDMEDNKALICLKEILYGSTD